jgi:cysteine synthase A
MMTQSAIRSNSQIRESLRFLTLVLAGWCELGDTAYQITDEEALPVLFDLIEHEGLVLGGSSAINIVGAMRLARDLGPGKTIVTILADGGQRYQSKLFNPDFLRKKNLPLPPWLK